MAEKTYREKRAEALTEHVEQLARIRAYPIERAWQDARVTTQENLHLSYGTAQESTWTIDLDIIDGRLLELGML